MILKREPVAIANAVRLVLLALIAFGLHLSPVQLIASMAALEAVLTVIARQTVTPNTTVDELVDTTVRLANLGRPAKPATRARKAPAKKAPG